MDDVLYTMCSFALHYRVIQLKTIRIGSMIFGYLLLFVVVIANTLGENAPIQTEIKRELAKLEEHLSKDPQYTCIEKIFCLQAMDITEIVNNPIKMLAKLTKEHGFDEIRKYMVDNPNLQLAFESLEIGDAFHTKSRCEKAFPKCEIASYELETKTEQKISHEDTLPSLSGDISLRLKRSSYCGSRCRAYTISCIFLTLVFVVGAPCAFGIDSVCGPEECATSFT